MLLLRIAEGDEQAFASLFMAWATPLSAIAMRIVKNEYVRQEVVQEVFIKVWLYRDRLGKVEHLSAWLRKITINQSLLALQRHAASDKRLAELRLSQEELQEQANTLELKETRRLVQEAIDSLPQQRRTIYRLNRVEGKTTREIAEELQLSHGYVRNALSAALAAIRDRLSASGLLALLLFVHY